MITNLFVCKVVPATIQMTQICDVCLYQQDIFDRMTSGEVDVIMIVWRITLSY